MLKYSREHRPTWIIYEMTRALDIEHDGFSDCIIMCVWNACLKYIAITVGINSPVSFEPSWDNVIFVNWKTYRMHLRHLVDVRLEVPLRLNVQRTLLAALRIDVFQKVTHFDRFQAAETLLFDAVAIVIVLRRKLRDGIGISNLKNI